VSCREAVGKDIICLYNGSQENDAMQLLTWNTNFWKEKENPKWKEVSYKLIQEEYDFILLQETNPFFICDVDYKRENGPIYYFQYGNKNIYYHELSDILLTERPNDIFWGTAIITNKTIKNVKTNYLTSDYFGHTACMCYDFELEKGKVITIINFYKKADTCKAEYDDKGKCVNLDVIYRYDSKFFSDIIKTVINKNAIVFAGDFNLTKRKEYMYDKHEIIKKIENIGFTNKTKDIGTTMLKYDNQNDYIFVNNDYAKSVDNITKIRPQNNFTDHYGIKCKIII
jgi:endonuclease/exonuclease/phosphatase family metal-dependent hydrolase